MLALFFKSHINGYTKKDGTYVAPHENKVVKKVSPMKAQFDHKAPLPPEAYARVGAPVEQPPATAPKSYPKNPMEAVKQSLKNTSDLSPSKAAYLANKQKKWQNKLHGGGTDKKLFPGEAGAPKKQGGLFGGGGWWQKNDEPKHYPNAVTHPQRNDEGKPVQINEPSHPSAPDTWSDPHAAAVFTPGSAVPQQLNGIPFAPWADAPADEEAWQTVAGQNPSIAEPAFDPKGKKPAAGVIIEEPDGRIWLLNPTNGFGGYDTTYPKGRVEDGLSMQASAIKEAFEETGLQVEITGFVCDIERSVTMARFYRARRVGGTPAAMGWEAQAVQLVPKDKLHHVLNTQVDRGIAEQMGVHKVKPAKHNEHHDVFEDD